MKPKNINKTNTSIMKMKWVNFLVLGIFLLAFAPFVSSLDNLGTGKVDECFRIKQLCSSCSYVNISSINYPNKTVIISNIEMISFGNGEWYYNFCNTTKIGNYDVSGQGDINGVDESFATYIIITATGEEPNSTQGFILIAQLGFVALLFGLGRVFDKRKWKIKMLFDMLSALMTLVLINSLKIVSSQSFKLTTMGELAFYIGFVLVSFLFLYLFVNATIELIDCFKKNKERKWGVNFYAN